MRLDIRISGTGGQGAIWAGTTLAVAAAKYSNLHATQSAFYGPETRGGYSRADIVISDEEIDFPGVIEASILVVMSQRAFELDLPVLFESGAIVADSVHVKDFHGVPRRVFCIPATEISEQSFGSSVFANSLILGFLDRLFTPVPYEALEKAVAERSPPRLLDRNLQALKKGHDYIVPV